MHEVVYEEMIAYCRQGLPNEACGLISGPAGTDTGHTLWKLPNEAKQKNRFLLSEDTVAEALEEIRRKGDQLTGIFHSHPTKVAYPSAMDIACNPYPGVAYIIISFTDSPPDVRCFTMKDNKLQQLDIVLFRNK
ncbi:M67 family metallopeptidase [Aneurinibacillus migulanus]|uniref:M67 family metallopeptidase n=1 Tax=Aneurinibacillus migulanus TaxID=47500 RepID=UPI0021009F37|nr:M67 family metallopeptidase [Aneurinibacillus migulanus]MED0895488.1 M67 family metallopeptidase [Aneurinibacillus migulanus]MED1618350.1 M67 family metallopeptidase [Aneurinibacillus migulanus]MED4729334.1 M67 family metallopeptidase [Aneurinibacillus migulanus]